MNKYHAIKTTVDGITFDSKLEAAEYLKIKALKNGNAIQDFRRQVKYPIGGGRNYIADFVLKNWDESEEVIECKGYETALWKLKKALFTEKYPEIKMTVVKGRK